MAKTKQQKQEMLDNINQKIKDSNSLIISVFDNLTVDKDQQLRSELRKNKVEYQVVKKTLLKKSFQENKITELPTDLLINNISLAASSDEVAGAKILFQFTKDKDDFKIIGGILNKVWVDAEKIIELAKLPTKQELLTKIVYTIQAPVSGFVNVLVGNIKSLANVLNAIKKSNE